MPTVKELEDLKAALPKTADGKAILGGNDAGNIALKKLIAGLTGHDDPYIGMNERMLVSAGILPVHIVGGETVILMGFRPQPQIGKGDPGEKLASVASGFVPIWNKSPEDVPSSVSQTLKMAQDRLGIDLADYFPQTQFLPFFTQMKGLYNMANQHNCVGQVETMPLFLTEADYLATCDNAAPKPLTKWIWMTADELADALSSCPHELDPVEVDFLYFALRNAAKIKQMQELFASFE